jgi:hypothetical protein
VSDETTDKVETIIGALRRLTRAAGASIAQDVCSIRATEGWAFNGVVWTTVKYPFGFAANLPAALLRDILTMLQAPTIETDAATVTLKETGRKFKVNRVITDVQRWPRTKPEGAVALSGAWLRILDPAIPLRTGHKQFVGVLAGPEGYVSTDGALLGHLNVPGPAQATIVPREILDALPSIPVKFSSDKDSVWVESEDGTTWQCPPLCGEFHDWKRAFPKVDKEIAVRVEDFKSAIRAVSIVSRYVTILTEGGGLIRPMVVGDEAIRGADAEARFTIERQDGKPLQVTVDGRKLLEILEVLRGQALTLSSNTGQTHLLLRPLDQQPEVRFVLAHVRGTSSY